MLRVSLQEMLNSLTGHQAINDSPPAIQPAQAAVPIIHTQAHQPPLPKRTPSAHPPQERRTHQSKTGLRPPGMTQYQLDDLAKGARVFAFPLEAVWVDKDVFTIEAVGWEHRNGAISILEIWSGDQGIGETQTHDVELDSRGHYVVIQIHHDQAIGTRWRRLEVPRSGRRSHMHMGVGWRKAFESSLPKGLTEKESLTTHVALSLLSLEKLDESDIKWFSRRRDTPVVPVAQRYQLQ